MIYESLKDGEEESKEGDEKENEDGEEDSNWHVEVQIKVIRVYGNIEKTYVEENRRGWHGQRGGHRERSQVWCEQGQRGAHAERRQVRCEHR